MKTLTCLLKKSSIKNRLRYFTIFCSIIVYFLGPTTKVSVAQVAKDPLPIIYIHGGGGMAFSWLTSSGIGSLLENDFGIESIGAPFSWSINAGIRNIVQLEYRRGDAAHNFIKNGLVGDGGFQGTGFGTIATVKMDYDFEDRIIKVNPFFWIKSSKNGVNIAYFIIVGKGKVTYRDEVGDGFEGDSNIYGIEVAVIRRFVTAGFSVKRYTVKFNNGMLSGIPFQTALDASQIQVQVNMAVGLGF